MEQWPLCSPGRQYGFGAKTSLFPTMTAREEEDPGPASYQRGVYTPGPKTAKGGPMK